MGMYDKVTVPCAECGDTIEFQSKAVPPEIAIDLDGRHVLCKSCFATTTLP